MLDIKDFDLGKVEFTDEELERPYETMKYNLYFQINDNKPELQGTFDTYDEALKYMEQLIKEKSRIRNTGLRRYWRKDGVVRIDYGAHNALYLIEEEAG